MSREDGRPAPWTFTIRPRINGPAGPRWAPFGVTPQVPPLPASSTSSRALGSCTTRMVRPRALRPLATTSRYDPITNTWKNLTPSPRGGAGLAADRVVVGGQPRIDLVGGPRPGNNLQYIP